MIIKDMGKILIFSMLILISYTSHGQKDTSWIENLKAKVSELPLELSTSIELKYGSRVVDPVLGQKSTILGEARWQLGLLYYSSWSEVNAKVDLFYDGVFKQSRSDLRELNIDFYPQSWWNAKIGRQALTWGKGDLVFINDLFPKDFRSFFSGRDIQYLKAPSDAFKFTLNPSWIQFNFIYTPQFDPDRYPLGDRVTFYDQAFQQYRSENNNLPVITPEKFFSEDEIAWRLQKAIGSYDLAFYGYYGYWKSPVGLDLSMNAFTHPKLNVHGLSFEGGLFGGIWGVEMGYYQSLDDAEGEDPFIRNSEWRWLVNYNRDFKGNWTVGLQYYSEIQSNYDNYLSTVGSNIPLDQVQDMITFRLRKMSHKQRVDWSLFTFYSFANSDVYVRPRIAYSISDQWKVDLGANIFAGTESFTLWNNFNTNNNIYIGLKWAI